MVRGIIEIEDIIIILTSELTGYRLKMFVAPAIITMHSSLGCLKFVQFYNCFGFH